MSTAFEKYQDGPLSAAAFGRKTSMGSDEIRHRLGYHKGTKITMPQHEKIRAAYIALAEAVDDVLPNGHAKDLAFDRLQESSMWANFGVAEQAPLETPS